jgi:hypothetical protein
MRASLLRRHFALAVVIGLTLWAGLAAAGTMLTRDARRQRASHAVANYKDHVRQIFVELYDDVQPMEDAVNLVLLSSDSFPARDLIASKQVSTGIDLAVHRLSQLRPPAALTGSARRLVEKLRELGTAVDSFPPLDRKGEYLAVRFAGAGTAMETALYEVSVPLEKVLGDRVPAMPGREESAKKRPLSRGSFIVASAHICGPADKKIAALPPVDDETDPTSLPTIRRTAQVMTRVLDQLNAVPRPPDDAATLKREVVTPLQRDPSIATALTDLVAALETHDEAALSDLDDEFNDANETTAAAADGLESYGALSCADLLTAFLPGEDKSLNA